MDQCSFCNNAEAALIHLLISGSIFQLSTTRTDVFHLKKHVEAFSPLMGSNFMIKYNCRFRNGTFEKPGIKKCSKTINMFPCVQVITENLSLFNNNKLVSARFDSLT